MKTEDEYNEGKLALEVGLPVGTIGCPHCGNIHHGIIKSPICDWCEKDMFSKLSVLNEATESEVIVCIDCKRETQISSDKLCYRRTKLREQANTTKRN